mgnify:CR=1 FL=1
MVARISYISHFSKIAREHIRQLDGIEEQFKNVENDYETAELEDRLITTAMIVVIFSITALEAYIYDYAARNFSDSFVRSYIDRLDITGKWVLVPNLITGKELPRDREWFALLRQLTKMRNKLVHYKSSEIPTMSELKNMQDYVKSLAESDIQIVDAAKKAIRLLDLAANEIINNNPEEKPWVETFLAERREE